MRRDGRLWGSLMQGTYGDDEGSGEYSGVGVW